MSVRMLCVCWVLVLQACSAVLPEERQPPPSIAGDVVIHVSEKSPFADIRGKSLPRANFPVYLFTWDESEVLREWFDKLDNDMSALSENPGDPEKQWIAEKRSEDIYRMIVPSSPSRRRMTDKSGQFAFEGLEVGEKYFVVGAKLEQEGFTLLPRVVGPLLPGENRIRLVEE